MSVVISSSYEDSAPIFSPFLNPCESALIVFPRYVAHSFGSFALYLISSGSSSGTCEEVFAVKPVAILSCPPNLNASSEIAKEQPQLFFEQDWNSRKKMINGNEYFTSLKYKTLQIQSNTIVYLVLKMQH